MIIDFLLNIMCKKKLEKQREKLKLKIADLENYRDRAIQRVNEVKEYYNQRLNDVFEHLSKLEINIKNNFYKIVHDELIEVSNIVKQSYEIVFHMIDLDWQIKILTSRKNNKKTEITIRKRSKDEAVKILKILFSSYKKDARLKWFNEVNDNNIKCIEELNKLKTEDNSEDINILIDLCERDLINRDHIVTIKKYINTEDKILNMLLKDVDSLNEQIKNIKNKAIDCYMRYRELQNQYYDLYNRQIDDNKILPGYQALIQQKDQLKIIKGNSYKKADDFSKDLKNRCINREKIVNYEDLKYEEKKLWDNYKDYKVLFKDSNDNVNYYYETIKFLIEERKKSIKELYTKSIITLKQVNEMGITYYKNNNSDIKEN
ncbi:hypothetical protein BRSU_0229 [Brachyspira suanatina]|uniref:Uncharacterized protein n=1 Tax=Brachyspira suanatina TaxID=381802 RepID=A0A0G4K3K5_9SPIR|nr:hypothetical protein [Brachyspira suanatina]CRF31564.1 hypothetical protein BRSU_0229 [Brachyspira suanatina]